MAEYHPVAFIILDGFGIWRETKGNAVLVANTPNLKYISRNYPGVALQASGTEVGLSWGEMGNSEVGHINLGAGLIVYQSLSRIQFAIQDGSYFKLPLWEEMIAHAAKNNGAIHIMGLFSNGTIHSHIEHALAFLKVIAIKKVTRPVYIHFFTDGQDVTPKSAQIYLTMLENTIQETKIGKIATMMGRYYAMDKSQRWDRTERAFECLTQGKGTPFPNAKAVIDEGYAKNLGDEFFEPAILDKEGTIKDGDALFFFNFRPDRARQITEIFLKAPFKNLFFATMTEYNKDYPIKIAIAPQIIANPIAKVVSDAGKKQFHVAETEKYAHITYFLNGGTEKPFAGEDRVIVPSPKTESYIKTPEMSSRQIAEEAVKAIDKKIYNLICINFAGTDIISHTGNFEATVQAIGIVDECIGKIKDALDRHQGAMLITADHGNCEEMINLATEKIDTEHSTNPVPCWMITPFNKLSQPAGDETDKELIVPNGILADASPTVLEMMGMSKHPEMSGRSLLGTTTPLVLK